MTTVNVLLSTFHGLGLPSTLCLTLAEDLSLVALWTLIASLLPSTVVNDAWICTGNGRKLDASDRTIRSLLTKTHDGETSFLPLRLNVPLRGGKGGFGSQLRAAGGRMSSRKKKQNAELASGSARNLDGRRLRTITEAKNLATYLATKPDMDRKEKEERRKRWEAVIELAEQREADMKAGKTVDGRRKGLSSEWLEEKEEIGDNVKNAVKLAMTANKQELEKPLAGSDRNVTASDSADEDSDADEPMELDEIEMARLRDEAEAGDIDALWVLKNKLRIPRELLPKAKAKPARFAGFDDELSDSDSEDDPSFSSALIDKRPLETV